MNSAFDSNRLPRRGRGKSLRALLGQMVGASGLDLRHRPQGRGRGKSYARCLVKWSGRVDLNHRPLRPERSALPV